MAHPCRTCAIPNGFCSTDGVVRAVIEDLKTSMRYRRGDVIFREEEPSHSVFIVCEGRVKLVTASREGRLLLLSFADPGHILGLAEAVMGGTPFELTAIAAEPSTVAMIPREKFLRLIATSPIITCRVTFALAQQYRTAQREEKFLGFGDSSTVRLAHLLLEWAAERGRPGPDGVHIPLHVTRGDLAHAIGTTRETATRALAAFARAGIVDRRRDEIVITDTAQLARIAKPPTVTDARDESVLPEAGDDLSICVDRAGGV